ncbi:unnamed protein product [Ectocarpus fasciculatus]
MRVLVASVVGTAFLLGAEDRRVITEAFVHPSVPGNPRTGITSGRGTAGNNRGLAAIRRRAPARRPIAAGGRGRPPTIASETAVLSSRSEGEAGEEGQRRLPTQRGMQRRRSRP